MAVTLRLKMNQAGSRLIGIINLEVKGLDDKRIFYLYQIDEEVVSNKLFELNSLMQYKGLNKEQQIFLKAKSITTLSSFNLSNIDFGIIK